jgi:RNA polymerase sigma-70 factor (ECF subfamily)
LRAVSVKSEKIMGKMWDCALILVAAGDYIAKAFGKALFGDGPRQVADEIEIRLVESAAGGDLESFGRLARRYYPAIVAIGFSVARDHGLAEDAAQECFARALVRLGSLKKREKFGAWLAAICRNIARDMLRAKMRRAKLESSASPPNNDVRNEKAEAVMRGIGKLGAADREIVMLRYYQNLSHERIAVVMGVSPAAVNGRLTRAKRKMAKLLNADGFGEDPL